MWGFTPFETDSYVSAEDDAIFVEIARENARERGADPSDGICYVCDKTISECGGPKAHEREEFTRQDAEEAIEYQREHENDESEEEGDEF